MRTYTYTRSQFIQNILNRHKSGWSCGCPSGLHGDMGYCSCGVSPAGRKAKLLSLLPFALVMRRYKYKGQYKGRGLHQRIG